MQYVLVIRRGIVNVGDNLYKFKFFSNGTDLINYVADMTNGSDEVHRIFSLNYNGEVVPYTITFKNGKLQLENS